jgi:hypothetical protein
MQGQCQNVPPTAGWLKTFVQLPKINADLFSVGFPGTNTLGLGLYPDALRRHSSSYLAAWVSYRAALSVLLRTYSLRF